MKIVEFDIRNIFFFIYSHKTFVNIGGKAFKVGSKKYVENYNLKYDHNQFQSCLSSSLFVS